MVFIRTLVEIVESEREIICEECIGRHFWLKQMDLDFLFLIPKGYETLIWYKHHVESVYCIEGEGEIELCEKKIEKGTSQIIPI